MKSTYTKSDVEQATAQMISYLTLLLALMVAIKSLVH